MSSSRPDEIDDKFHRPALEAARHLRGIYSARNRDERNQAIQDLAADMYWLRKNCVRRDGKPDLRGQSAQYKSVMSFIRRRAAEDDGEPAEIPTQVNHRIQDLMYVDPEIDEATRYTYGLPNLPSHRVAREAWTARRSDDRALTGRPAVIGELTHLMRLIEQLDLRGLIDADEATRDEAAELLARLESRLRERHGEIGTVY